MAVRDYREMYITTILTMGKDEDVNDEIYNRSDLAKLTLEELKGLAEKNQG